MIISSQAIAVWFMFWSGIVIGAAVDSFRLYWWKRRTTRHYFFHRIYELILFALLGILTFWILFEVKSGAWRIVDPLAQFLGIYVYHLVFKKVARKGGALLYYVFIYPFIRVGHFFVMLVRITIAFFSKLMFGLFNFVKK